MLPQPVCEGEMSRRGLSLSSEVDKVPISGIIVRMGNRRKRLTYSPVVDASDAGAGGSGWCIACSRRFVHMLGFLSHNDNDVGLLLSFPLFFFFWHSFILQFDKPPRFKTLHVQSVNTCAAQTIRTKEKCLAAYWRQLNAEWCMY